MLNSKLDNVIKTVRMLNSSSDVLDEILKSGKNVGNVSGLGFENSSEVDKRKWHEVTLAQPKRELKMSNNMLQHSHRHQKNFSRRKYQKWRCHYCGRFGHIKPFCYKL